jgi:hypothetical protein
MERKRVRTSALMSIALVVMFGAAWEAKAQDTKIPYPRMAPIDQYLMADRNAEIAMARSAAPKAISGDAEVLVLGRHGYPKMRGPICFNPPAARSILPLTIKRTELVLAGLSKAQIIDGIKAFETRELPALEPGAMCYMMSSQGYLNDSAGHWLPHLMFYIPLTDAKVWGADLPGSPVMLNPQFQGAPEPITEFMIPVGHWSDGTAATPKDER